MYRESDAIGDLLFDNLEYGTYELIEISPAEAFIPNTDTYKVIVDENGNYDIQKHVVEKITRTVTEQVVDYVPEVITKYSHTPNVSDSGTLSSWYANNLLLNNVVTIPGAESLEVTVYYYILGGLNDWVAIYDGTITPSEENAIYSISGRMSGCPKSSPDSINYAYFNSNGYKNTCASYTTTIQGDTVQFLFKSDNSGGRYGYYAIIKGTTTNLVPSYSYETVTHEDVNERYESIYNQGKFEIFNEPLHDVIFLKKDSLNSKNIEGAQFRLHGVSNEGNVYDSTELSNSMGFVNFKNLESGNYILEEVSVPDGVDENGNVFSYTINKDKYIVSVNQNGTFTIDGLEQNEMGYYVFNNDRNKGQITITKKWIDDSNNEERPEPVIHLDGEKPVKTKEETTIQYFKNNQYVTQMHDSVSLGSILRGPLWELDKNYCMSDYYQSKFKGTFKRSTRASMSDYDAYNLGAIRVDKDYSNANATYKIYAWLDSQGNCWWWSNAEVAAVTNASNNIFFDTPFKSIDLTGLDFSECTGNIRMPSNAEIYGHARRAIDYDTTNYDNAVKYSTADINYDNDNNEIHWVKNGDIWSYTFYVDNPNSKWYAWEEGMQGYSIDYTKFNTVEVKNQKAEITNCSSNYANYINKETFDLEISKELIGIDTFEEKNLTENDDDTVFILEVKITPPSNKSWMIDGLKIFGKYMFNNGVGQIEIKAGERLIIPGLPENTSYTITERKQAGYETSKTITGRISGVNENVAIVVNYKDIRKKTNEKFDVEILKQDAINQSVIAGARFKLSGIADDADTYDEEVESDSEGLIRFTDVKPGSYSLRELSVQNSVDANNNIIKYVVDNNYYLVTVTQDGNVSIEGLEKNQDGKYVFYNQRDVGKITITKKWYDESNNDERPEPVIHISNEQPCESAQYVRDDIVENGFTYSPLRAVSTYYSSEVRNNVMIRKDLREDEVLRINPTRIDREYYDENAKYKIYAWIGDGNCYFWTNADKIKLTNNNRKLFNLSNAKTIDLTGFDTSEMTDMSNMFYRCKSANTINVSGFDTSNVTNFSSMFELCNNLTQLDVSGFDTSKATNFSSMFESCNNLTQLDVSGFDTSKATNMRDMFYACLSVTQLDVSNFVTDNVTDMRGIFWRCRGLTELGLSTFDTSNVTNMSYMFCGCKGLTELDLSTFDTSNVTDMSSMFDGCNGLTELNLSGFDTSNVTNMSYMFSGCSGLTELDLSRFDTSDVTNMSYMFKGCSGLTELDLSGFNTSNVTYMYYMFSGCSSLTSINLSDIDTSSVTSMECMFYHCSSLTSIDLSDFDTSNVTTTGYMFSGCTQLETIDLSCFNNNSWKSAFRMFIDCSNLTTIYVSESYVNNITSGSDMFANCYKLVGGNGTTYSESNTGASYACIDTEDTPGYYTKKIITGGSTNSQMFLTLNGLMELLSKEKTEVKVSQTYLNERITLLAPGDNQNNSSEAKTYSTAETNYDNEGNEVHWVKNGDTWTYSFYVDNPDDTWYVWEDKMDGYETEYIKEYVNTINNREASISNYTINNRAQAKMKYGDLTIEKKLLKYNGKAEITADEDSTEFTFKITLSSNVEYLADLVSGTKIIGNHVFKDGVTYVTLKSGESVTIKDIPVGLKYNVEELHVLGYRIFDGDTGVINVDGVTVSAVNYKNKEQPEKIYPSSQLQPIEQEKLTNITIKKDVIGNAEEDEEYNFEIILYNLQSNTEYSVSNGDTFKSDSVGSANLSLSLKDKETVTIQNIPVGTRYKVYEHAGDYISSYVIADANNLGLISNTAKNNTKMNKDLSTNTETADEGEDVTITFTNKRIVTQNLKVQKIVTDAEDTNSYIFEIEFANMEPGSSLNSSIGKVTAEDDGKAYLQIYLAGGEEAEFYNIPVGTTYTVKELASGAIASYAITDANGTNQIVSDSKANTVAKMALSTETETVNQGEDVTVTFINDTVNQEPDSVSTSLGVTKNVVNKDGEKVGNCEDKFIFELSANDETNPMPKNNSVEIKGNGTASFGTITFDETGTYVYTVVEKAGDNKECQYDNSKYTIVYEVTNIDGLLAVTKVVKKNGFESNVVEFTNIMEEKEEVNPEKPVEPTDSTENTKPEDSKEEPGNKGDGKAEKPIGVQTGDNVVIVMSILVLAGIVVMFTFKLKRENNTKR